jgi:hypothetical protein
MQRHGTIGETLIQGVQTGLNGDDATPEGTRKAVNSI